LESDSTYLPKQICQNCNEALNHWTDIRDCVQKSEEFYQHQLQLRQNSQPEFINTYNNCYIKKEIDDEEVMTINVNPELIYNEYENGEKSEDNYDYPCGVCELGFNDINLFENHYKNHIDIGSAIPCGICSSNFENIESLLKHLKEHKNDPNKKLVYNCDICNTEYNCKKNLLLHIKIIHNNTNTSEQNFENLFSNHIEHEYPLYHCGICKEDYVGIKNFTRHFTLSHKDNNELICGVCSSKFKQLQLLLKHEQNHKINKTKTTYTCQYCNDIFKRNGTLVNHIRNKHSDKLPNKNNINTYTSSYKCGICKIGFSHIVEFAKHFPVKHSHYDELPCGICTRVFNKLPLLLRHEQEHKRNNDIPKISLVNNITTMPTIEKNTTCIVKKENIEFICKFCSKKFKDHTEYCKHMNKHEPTICPHCKNAFETEHQLRAHILNRHPQGSCKKRRIPCPICGKFFTQNSAMKAHMELHSNARNYVCEFCSKSYRSLSTLLHHRRLHTSNRKFYCDFCQRAFNFKSAMKKHIMLHINYLPNKCRFCDKRFNTITVLKKHIQMKHLGILHHCIRCNKGFHDIRNCRRHMKTICQVPFEEIPYKRDRQFIYNQAVK
jgi:KRAB domain-containing zinc finger protein